MRRETLSIVGVPRARVRVRTCVTDTDCCCWVLVRTPRSGRVVTSSKLPPRAQSELMSRLSMRLKTCTELAKTLRLRYAPAWPPSSSRRAHPHRTARLRHTRGVIKNAAAMCGIGPRSLYDRMQQHQLRKEDYKR